VSRQLLGGAAGCVGASVGLVIAAREQAQQRSAHLKDRTVSHASSSSP
jgi:hypothetical protein